MVGPSSSVFWKSLKCLVPDCHHCSHSGSSPTLKRKTFYLFHEEALAYLLPAAISCANATGGGSGRGLHHWGCDSCPCVFRVQIWQAQLAMIASFNIWMTAGRTAKNLKTFWRKGMELPLKMGWVELGSEAVALLLLLVFPAWFLLNLTVHYTTTPLIFAWWGTCFLTLPSACTAGAVVWSLCPGILCCKEAMVSRARCSHFELSVKKKEEWGAV